MQGSGGTTAVPSGGRPIVFSLVGGHEEDVGERGRDETKWNMARPCDYPTDRSRLEAFPRGTVDEVGRDED